VQLIVDRGVERKLKGRRLERLAGRSGATTLGPVRQHLVRPARSIRHAAVKRLYRQTALRAPADQRVEAPAEPVDLDDIARPDSLESHVAKRTRDPGALPVGSPALPSGGSATFPSPYLLKYLLVLYCWM
jgi:hypothetical protein